MAQYSIELGWMNILPCSKLTWTKTSIPAVYKPELIVSEQRFYAWAVIDSQNMQDEALQAVKDCALAAFAAAGGIGAVSQNPVAAAGAFTPAFLACFVGKFSDIAISNIEIETRSVCQW